MSVLVVYWSGTGNTEIMAKKMFEGVKSTNVSAVLKSVEEISVKEAASFEKIMFGCPSMGIEQLEEEDFEPFYTALEPHLAGKKIAIFGSYGWGDGEWLIDWEKRVINQQGILFEKGLKINSVPSSDEEVMCFEFGVRFAKI